MNKWPRITLHSRWGRLALVPPSPADDMAVAALRSDPATTKHFHSRLTMMSAEEWRTKREADDMNDSLWNFHVHLTPGHFVGQCVLWQIDLPNRSAEIGIILTAKLHRKGLGTEVLYTLLEHAFEYAELRLHRVQLVTAADNVQMQGWCDRFGIGVEHRIRDMCADGSGGWIDGVGFSVLEGEWPALKPRLAEYLTTASHSDTQNYSVQTIQTLI